jgi:uncharacterized protein YecE (DUF72 family)
VGSIRIGCSGWVYRDWRGVLYPPGLPQRSWLARYAEVFDTVEVNSTFYRLARPGAADGWLAATPPGFLFTCKASRYLTHMKRLRDMDAGASSASTPRWSPLPRSDAFGPVLWQLPRARPHDLPRLTAALDALPRRPSRVRVPPPLLVRATTSSRCCRSAGVALVIGDHPSARGSPGS